VVSRPFAPKWTPRGFAQRIRYWFRQPSDVLLAAQIALFIWRAPAHMRGQHLGAFLASLRSRPRPRARSVQESLERIQRLRGLCLWLPPLRSRNSCYIRALTLYRFLEAGEDKVTIHFGIEERDDPAERLRGHAWVELNGRLLEGPPEVIHSVLREVPLGGQGLAG
jgi:hypothetical protein